MVIKVPVVIMISFVAVIMSFCPSLVFLPDNIMYKCPKQNAWWLVLIIRQIKSWSTASAFVGASRGRCCAVSPRLLRLALRVGH